MMEASGGYKQDPPLLVLLLAGRPALQALSGFPHDVQALCRGDGRSWRRLQFTASGQVMPITPSLGMPSSACPDAATQPRPQHLRALVSRQSAR